MPSSLGPAEILVILIVALIVLGPNKLPGAARQVGKTLAEVRKWSQGFQDEIRTAIDSSEAPSYPPPVVPAPDAAAPGALPGPATPAEAEYTGPTPETAPPIVPDLGPVPAATIDTVPAVGAETLTGGGTPAPASANGSTPGPVSLEPSEPPAGETPPS